MIDRTTAVKELLHEITAPYDAVKKAHVVSGGAMNQRDALPANESNTGTFSERGDANLETLGTAIGSIGFGILAVSGLATISSEVLTGESQLPQATGMIGLGMFALGVATKLYGERT